jgi:hypothetical protein
MGNGMTKAKPGYWFDFSEPPPVGLRIRYRKDFLTLIGVTPHRCADGRQSHILQWVSDSGKRATSGFRGNSASWVKEGK